MKNTAEIMRSLERLRRESGKEAADKITGILALVRPQMTEEDWVKWNVIKSQDVAKLAAERGRREASLVGIAVLLAR
jgi:hypothetical protein